MPGLWISLKLEDTFSNSTTFSNLYIRPVINLSPDAQVIKGNGSFDNPYILES